MSSINKKWLLFVNLLFNLTLSNNLLAVENSEEHGSDNNTDPDTQAVKKSSNATQQNAKLNSKKAHEQSLEQIIQREKLLIRVITEESIYAEEKFLEKLSIQEYSRLELIAEELFLEHLAKESISLNTDISLFTERNNLNVQNLSEVGLSIAAIYNDDDSAKLHAINILNHGKNHAKGISEDDLQIQSNATAQLVHQNLEILKIASIKKAASQIAIETAESNNLSKEKNFQEQKSLAKLIEMKNTASMLAQDKINTENTSLSQNIKNPVSSVKSIAKEIKYRKSTLSKLAALKETASELHAEKITELKDLSKNLENKSDKLEKLSQLKAVESALLSNKLQAETGLEPNQQTEKNTKQNHRYQSSKPVTIDSRGSSDPIENLGSYITESNIILETDKNQNYILVTPVSTTVPTASKQITEEETISEKIEFGVKIIPNKKEREAAELAEVSNEIAPLLESIEFDPDATELLLVDSKMNNKERIKTTLIAFNKSKNLVYAPLDTIKSWEINGPYPEPVDFQGHSLIPLHDMHNIVADLNRGDLKLNLSVPTEAFSNQIINFNQQRQIPQAYSDLGLYLNYDGLYTKSDNSQALSSILLSPVVFSNFGFISNRFRYLSDASDNSEKFTRIESYFQKDFPSRLTTLRVGDNISRSGAWGRSTAFTGIQYGTNFSTQPEFLSTPLPSLFSETNAPSTVDIYINDRLAKNVDVEPGPFEIRNIPPLNGNGQIQFVIKDELGRERIVTTDFYANRSLLRPGVSDYSINLGVQRQDIGRASANYGSALGVVNYRRGITDSLTLGTRGEFSKDTNNIGLSANYTLGKLGTLESSAALSKNDSANAALWRLGYRYSRDQFNIATTYQKSDEEFRFIGSSASTNLLSQVTLSTGYNTNDYGSIGFSHVKQNLTNNKRSVNSLSYSKTFLNKYSFGFYASNASDSFSDRDTQFGISFSTSFDNGGAFNSSWSKTGARSRLNNTYQKSSQELLAPSYRINTTSLSGAPSATDIDASTRTQYFDIDARLNQRGNDLAHQVGAYGSFALLRGGYWGFTRDISDSFAVVKVSDFKNVGVYQQNRFIGRTNDKGYMIAPGLTPYLENTVRFDPVDVPLDTTFKTDESQIVPYSKSGVLVDFKIARSVSYSFSVVDEKNRLLPLGSNVEITDEHSSIVGYDGLVFVQVPENINKLTIGYGNRACEVELPTNIKPNKITGIISTDKLVCK